MALVVPLLSVRNLDPASLEAKPGWGLLSDGLKPALDVTRT